MTKGSQWPPAHSVQLPQTTQLEARMTKGVAAAARTICGIAANDAARGTYDEGGHSGRSRNLRNRGKRRSYIPRDRRTALFLRNPSGSNTGHTAAWSVGTYDPLQTSRIRRYSYRLRSALRQRCRFHRLGSGSSHLSRLRRRWLSHRRSSAHNDGFSVRRLNQVGNRDWSRTRCSDEVHYRNGCVRAGYNRNPLSIRRSKATGQRKPDRALCNGTYIHQGSGR